MIGSDMFTVKYDNTNDFEFKYINILFIGSDIITQNIIKLYIEKFFKTLNVKLNFEVKTDNLLDFFKEKYINDIYNIILVDVRSSNENKGDGIEWTYKNEFIRYIRENDKKEFPYEENKDKHKVFILLGYRDKFLNNLPNKEDKKKYSHYYFIDLDKDIYQLFEQTKNVMNRAIDWSKNIK
jgi:hypothetical protein